MMSEEHPISQKEAPSGTQMLPLSAWTIPSQPLVETESPPGMLNAVIVVVALINHRIKMGNIP
jgi:hypothetical protein